MNMQNLMAQAQRMQRDITAKKEELEKMEFVGKSEWVEITFTGGRVIKSVKIIKPGVIEEISIAVTLDKNALPSNTTLEELKELIAKAASPKVTAENVSIAFSDSTDPYLASDRPANLPKPDETGNPWWLTIVLGVIGLIIVFKAVSNKVQQIQESNRREVDQLRQKNAQQEQQLSDINQRAAQLAERQSELAQGLVEQQQRVYIPQQQNPEQLTNTISNLSEELAKVDEDEAGDKIKSWIEQG